MLVPAQQQQQQQQKSCTLETYTKSDGSTACGFTLQKGLTWQQANDLCKSQGGRLPEIRSKEENDIIFNFKVARLGPVQ